MNPTPPDPTQKMIFDWMPLIFTFMLAGFPAGLVIYWAWNNTLSVLQQAYIMPPRREGRAVRQSQANRQRSNESPASAGLFLLWYHTAASAAGSCRLTKSPET
jgi:YidC/Oxa1 family membrane protein insertase